MQVNLWVLCACVHRWSQPPVEWSKACSNPRSPLLRGSAKMFKLLEFEIVSKCIGNRALTHKSFRKTNLAIEPRKVWPYNFRKINQGLVTYFSFPDTKTRRNLQGYACVCESMYAIIQIAILFYYLHHARPLWSWMANAYSSYFNHGNHLTFHVAVSNSWIQQFSEISRLKSLNQEWTSLQQDNRIIAENVIDIQMKRRYELFIYLFFVP